MGKFKDLTGQRFYNMIVLERAYKPNDKHTFWKCRCDCGNIFVSRADAILNNRVKSCGCGLGKYPNLIGQKYGLLTPLNIDLITRQTTQQELSFEDLKGETNYLYFDFGIYHNNKLKYIIEYQGRQHYEPIEYFGGETRFQKQLQYDNKKQQYCEKHNIPLKIISYKEQITSDMVIDWSLLND